LLTELQEHDTAIADVVRSRMQDTDNGTKVNGI
jgi:hypothetical protein